MLGDTQLLLQSVGSLLLVLAILLLMVFAARRFMLRRPLGGRRLRFVEAMALGTRDKLLLVEVDGKSLLLGVTSQNIRLLTQLDAQNVLPPAFEKTEGSIPAPTSFAQQFSQLLGRHTSTLKPKSKP